MLVHLFRNLYAPLTGEAPVHDRQELGIDHGWSLSLLGRFLPGEGLQGRIPADRPTARFDQGLQGREDAGLPIDQSAVAVKAQNPEFRELYG